MQKTDAQKAQEVREAAEILKRMQPSQKQEIDQLANRYISEKKWNQINANTQG